MEACRALSSGWYGVPAFLLRGQLPSGNVPLGVQAGDGMMRGTGEQFDGEVAAMYGKFFYQLRPSWEAMLDRVDAVNSGGFGRPKSKRPDQHLQRVLDLASGPGQPALLTAARYRATRVESTDISPDMVAQAAASAAKAGVDDRVTCAVRDMNDLSSIEAGSMDLVTVSFGLMFTRSVSSFWLWGGGGGQGGWDRTLHRVPLHFFA